MAELKHGWVDAGTSAERYCVASPESGTMEEAGKLSGASSSDDIQLKQTSESSIELYNATEGSWWAFDWTGNSWRMTDSKWIGANASF